MKNYYLIMLLSLIFIGCNNKNVKKVEKVKIDPATIGMYVINNTDKPIYWHRTWGMNVKDQLDTIAVGEGKLLQSNTQPTQGATSFIGTINPPKGVQPGGPENGSWNYEWAFNGGNKMIINYANDGGSPSSECPATATKNNAKWAYYSKWTNGKCYKKNDVFTSMSDTLTFTTTTWPITE